MSRKSCFINLTFICLFFLGLSFSVSAAEPELKEGKWEITSKIEMPGMPVNMPQNTFTQTQCLTKDNYVPKPNQNQSGQNCQIKDIRTSGNTVIWTINCNSVQGAMKGKGQITYKGDSFEGTIKMSSPGGEIIQHMKGRRIGECE